MVLKKLTQDYNSHGLPVNIAIFRHNRYFLPVRSYFGFCNSIYFYEYDGFPNNVCQLFAEISCVKRSINLGDVYL